MHVNRSCVDCGQDVTLSDNPLVIGDYFVCDICQGMNRGSCVSDRPGEYVDVLFAICETDGDPWKIMERRANYVKCQSHDLLYDYRWLIDRAQTAVSQRDGQALRRVVETALARRSVCEEWRRRLKVLRLESRYL